MSSALRSVSSSFEDAWEWDVLGKVVARDTECGGEEVTVYSTVRLGADTKVFSVRCQII